MMHQKSPTNTADTSLKQMVAHTYNPWEMEEDGECDVILSYTMISRPVCGTCDPISTNRNGGGRMAGSESKVTQKPRRWYLQVLLRDYKMFCFFFFTSDLWRQNLSNSMIYAHCFIISSMSSGPGKLTNDSMTYLNSEKIFSNYKISAVPRVNSKYMGGS